MGKVREWLQRFWGTLRRNPRDCELEDELRLHLELAAKDALWREPLDDGPRTANPAFPYHAMFGPVYPASKTALNAITLAMMIELESTGIKVNLVSPAFTKTNLNGYAGTESVEDGSREVVRVALLGPDGPTGTFTRWENATIPW